MLQVPLAGVGIYSVGEASALIAAPPQTISRWLRGASNFQRLWTSELEGISDRLELGFRDLMEAKIVYALRGVGVSLQHIRKALEVARLEFNEPRPFSTARFRTDGNRIYWESYRALEREGEPELTDVASGQRLFWSVVKQTFLEIEIVDGVAGRWRPKEFGRHIVIDPRRSFGQPILEASGVPTRALFEAFHAEDQDAGRVAKLFEVPVGEVRRAIAYEQRLMN